MIIADTSGLLALTHTQEPLHARVKAFVRTLHTPLAVSPMVLAEYDYLLRTHAGHRVAREAISQLLGSRSLEIARLNAEDVQSALNIDIAYADLGSGLTDASPIVLAHRYGTLDLLTLDERHFRVMAPIGDGEFRLFPADLP
ncbi:MAG: VapC toxin family PIN domain ribonuclease [Acidimicrobiales bacterium]|nr:MAG: VapC toxin family PIN domain ribonuclease [Acidimicrobiales bacterium]